jgi:RHS repeat-associated protein
MLVSGPGQFPVTYTWDNANRLTDITRGGLAAHYMYDNANRRTQLRLPNLVTIDYGYDAANRLTSLTYSGLAGGTPTQNLTYTYDPAGNRTVLGGSWARTLLPNAISSASYDAANRQLALGGKSMTYDFNGNLTQISEGGQNTDLTWDVRDRLTNVNGPGMTASFAYDPVERRTQKTINAFATVFRYDGYDIVREVAGGSGVNYLRGLEIDEPLARIEDAGNTTCYAPDALGSTLALTDSAGSVATEYTYEPLGRTMATGAASQNSFQYTGRENDGTGLYYYRFRYYSPAIGRFVSEDPAGIAGGMNLYSYVLNSPQNWVDPLGLQPAEGRDACTQAGGRRCVGRARFSAVGPDDAPDEGAMAHCRRNPVAPPPVGTAPSMACVAIDPRIFGLPYSRGARGRTQCALAAIADQITITPIGLRGGPGSPFTVCDIGDVNIRRRRRTPRFDIYRFPTQEEAEEFGIQTVPVTISIPLSLRCPRNFQEQR